MVVVSDREKVVLRELAQRVAEIAELEIQREKAQMWKRLNQLDAVRAMVWINEIPWHEMDTNDELKLQTTHPFARRLEMELRRTIYQWKYMRGDMVVERKIYCPVVIHDTGFGIGEQSDILKVDERGVASRRFHPQIRSERDLEKIRTPEITYDEATTERNYETMLDIFDGILEVEKRGVVGTWFAPWDQLVTWWGVRKH